MAIAAGRLHTCALLADSSARCWGNNAFGQLNDGTTTNRLTPVTAIGVRAVAIAAGDDHMCALSVKGSASCWGRNGSGQLGNGLTEERIFPPTVALLSDGEAIAAGGAHTCALRARGGVSCWGSNASGQLGDSTTIMRLIPVDVPNLTNAVAIAAGLSHTCALLADGTASCWGDNGQGQLGDGTATTRITPVPVPNLANAVAIAAGEFHTCAVLANGTALCWGDNSSGQLGDGTTTDRLTPAAVTISFLQRSPSGGTVVVAPLGNIVQIATGRRHTCAIMANGFGAVRCWGENGSGQTGVGTTSDVLRPLSVPSFTLNIDPLVQLQDNTRVATVQIIAACEEGQQLHVNVTLTQGAVSGRGVGVGECTGGVERYPVTVPAQGRNPFSNGPAVVNAEALIRELGLIVDTQEWTRKVQVAIAP